MPNLFKYNTVAESNSLKKGNFYIGTGDVGKGPTSNTGFYNGITPPVGGYTIYINKANGGPSIRVAANTNELIRITNQISGQSYTSREECLAYFASQTDKIVLSGDIPIINTNGISMYLDPSNAISNPRGTTWYDLVNGLQFNSQGSLLSTSALGLGVGFQFNGSGYWQCSSNYNLVDLGGDCTVIMWVYSGTNPRNIRNTIFQKNGTVYASYEQEIAVTWETSTAMSWYSRVSDYDYAGTVGLNTPGWNMVGIKMSTGKTSAARTGFYSINGASWSNSYVSRSSTALVTAADIVIGSGYAGTVSEGGIGVVMCYNRMLSDTEITQTYNATKSLYGL